MIGGMLSELETWQTMASWQLGGQAGQGSE